jgi:hypothetical protein
VIRTSKRWERLIPSGVNFMKRFRPKFTDKNLIERVPLS